MLVGRATERQVIERLLAGARVGESGVLVLTGEAGIGKTALLKHAVSFATGMRVLSATGHEAEQEVAFGGLLQLLRPALPHLDRIPPPQADAVATALALRPGDVQGVGRSDRFTVGAGTLSLLSRFAEDGPLALLLDDAHLLDRPSAEAIAFSARRLLADPVVVLAAVRAGEQSPLLDVGLPVLPLHGLDLSSTGLLLVAGSSRPVAAGLVARAHEATGGNPLALQELADDLTALETAAPGVPVPVPVTVAASFHRRVQGLTAPARTVLMTVVTAGGDLATAAVACGTLGVELPLIEEAERAGLVRVENGRAEARHPLIRSTVYRDASPAERRAVHRALGAALTGHDEDRAAWHLSDAVIGPDPGVATRLEHTARRAGGRGAHSIAATAYERSARLTDQDGPRSLRLAAAGESGWLAGEAGRAGALLTEALALGLPHDARVRAQELRGVIASQQGSPRLAYEILTTAVAELERDDPEAAVVLLSEAVLACFFLADGVAALETAHRLDRLLEGRPPLLSRPRALLAAGIGRVLGGRNGTDEIREAVDLLASVERLDAEPRRSAWLLVAPLWLRESDTGRQLVARALEDERTRAAVGALPFLLFLTARDAATTDRWAHADASYQEAAALAEETGGITDLVAATAGRAWLHARQGRERECRLEASRVLEICRDHDIPVFRAWALFALGELELACGRPESAAYHLENLSRTLDEMGLLDVDLSPGPELTDALLRLGREEDARRVSARYSTAARAKGQPWALARAERAAGLLCADDSLDGHFQAALALHARTPDEFETARTQLAYGALLRRARRRVDARRPLRAALSTFERLGAVPWAELAAVELKATGETAHRRGSSSIDELTPQELRVALMLAEGRTTRQAAAALFLSPKTVEYHLRHVYTKLGIRSRDELANAVGRQRHTDSGA